MLTPQQLSSISDAVVAVFVELDTAMKVEGARRIANDPANVDRAAARAAMAALSSGASKEVSETIAATIKSAVRASTATDEQIYAAARLAGIIGPYAALGDSEVMTRIAAEAFGNVDNMLSLVKTSALQAVQASFNDAIDSAVVANLTGKAYTETVAQAVNKIAETTTKVTFMTAAGETIQQGLFSAVSSIVQTGTHQAVLRIQESRMRELGAEYVEVTAHSGARPDHQVWQGKVFKYPDEFQAATGYGTGGGLGGKNCRHSFYPFFPDIMEPLEKRAIPDEKENARLYELEQRQRLCERNIRGYKQRAAIQEAGGLTDDAAKSNALVRKWQKEATAVTKQSGGRRRYDRERMDPINRITDPGIAKTVEKITPPKLPTEEKIIEEAEEIVTRVESKTLDEALGHIEKLGFNVKKLDFKGLDERLIAKNIDVITNKALGNAKYREMLESFPEKSVSAGKLGKGTIASCGTDIRKTKGINFSFSTAYYKDAESFVKSEKKMRDTLFSMPSADKYIETYTATHETGHSVAFMLMREHLVNNPSELAAIEKKIAELKTSGKSLSQVKNTMNRIEKQQDKILIECNKEIYAKARSANPEINLRSCLSQYGQTNAHEAFAEMYANAYCGKPNALGNAMLEFLKERGYA